MRNQKQQIQQKENIHQTNSAEKVAEADKPYEIKRQNQPPFLFTGSTSSPNIPPSPQNILNLQQTIGNQAVGRFIRTKLKIGQPGDKYEQEADRVADTVMGMPNSSVRRQTEDEDETQRKPIADQITPLVQRQEADEEDLQAKSVVQNHESEEEKEKPAIQMLQRQEEEEEEIQSKQISEQITPVGQRQADEEEEPIQTKSLSGQIAPLVQHQVEEEEETIQGKFVSKQTTPLVQKQEEPEEEEETLLAKCVDGQSMPLVQMQEEPEEKEETIKKREASSQRPISTVNLGSQIRSLKRGGQPLPESLRAYFEPRFGYDFSNIRVHTGRQAAESTKTINAQAYTVGRDVVFGEGRYSPETSTGKKLLAHELTHVVQQNAGSSAKHLKSKADNRHKNGIHASNSLNFSASSNFIYRQQEEDVTTTESQPEITASAEFIKENYVDINELGIVYQESGANLRDKPLPEGHGSKVLRLLKPNTKVFILKHDKKNKWFVVTVMSSEGGGEFGYIYEELIWRKLPEPDVRVRKIKQAEYPLKIAAEEYPEFDVWGKDQRYVVNALVFVNTNTQHNGRGEPGLRKINKDVTAPWFTAKATSDVYIWLPGSKFLNVIYKKVVEKGGGTGSITADLWETAKKGLRKLAYGAAFIGGLVHGFVKSIVDTVVGIVQLIIDLLVSIFTANVLVDAYDLWETVSELTWDDIKNHFEAWVDKWRAKLESSSPWVAGHAHGYLTGYIMGEVAMMLISVGTLQALKGAKWVSKFAKAIKETKALQKLAKGVDKVKKTGGKAKDLLKKTGEKLKRKKKVTVVSKLLKLSRKVQKKILWGERVSGSNRIIGGHFRGIIGHPKFAVEIIGTSSTNPGCVVAKIVKELPGGAVSRIKKSTLFPRGWSKSDILKAIETVANNPTSKVVKGGATLSKGKVKGVIIEVIIRDGKIVSGYPL